MEFDLSWKWFLLPYSELYLPKKRIFVFQFVQKSLNFGTFKFKKVYKFLSL